jgi:hypothetical protein
VLSGLSFLRQIKRATIKITVTKTITAATETPMTMPMLFSCDEGLDESGLSAYERENRISNCVI